MNTNNSGKEKEETVLSLFFFNKTVEWRFLLDKFTPKMIAEILAFEPSFTEEDIRNTLNCKDSTECLYMVASIISRIRSEQSPTPAVEQNETPPTIEEVQQKVVAIFGKE